MLMTSFRVEKCFLVTEIVARAAKETTKYNLLKINS
jgi:hypothetical protein